MKSLASRDTPTSSVRSKFQRVVGAASPQQRKTATIAATVAIVGIAAIATPDPAYAQSANLEGFANNVLGMLSSAPAADSTSPSEGFPFFAVAESCFESCFLDKTFENAEESSLFLF